MVFELLDTDNSQPEEPLIPELSDALLADLFQAGLPILKLQPWKHLSDTDWFAIKDPETGQINIAAVMGNAGHFYALHIYLPEEGIRFWNDYLQSGTPNTVMGQFDQRLVSCEFVARNEEEMDEHDMELNKRHGIDYRGDGLLDALTFRAIVPGCINWHPRQEQAIQLLDGLRLLPRFAKNPKLRGENHYTTLSGGGMPHISCFELPEGKERTNPEHWEVKKITFPEAPPKSEPRIEPDPFFLKRLTGLEVRLGTTWEIGAHYDHQQVLTDGIVQWTMICLIVRHEDGMIGNVQVIPALTPKDTMLKNCFIEAATQTGYLPENLHFSSAVAEKTFAPLCGIPGLQLELKDKLPLLRQASAELKNDMSKLEKNGILENLSDEAISGFNDLMKQAPSADASPEELLQFIEQVSQGDGGKDFIEAAFGGSDLFSELGLLDGMKIDDSNGLRQKKNSPSSSSSLPKYEPPVQTDRYVFRIDLVGAKPPIWRRISVPVDSTFFDLHLAIQAVFGWTGYHLHSFEKRTHGRADLTLDWLGPDNDMMAGWGQREKETEVNLYQFFENNQDTINYVYDYGDYWDHKIKLEKKLNEPDLPVTPLSLLKGKGGFMVEDCGGIHGLMSLIDGDHPFSQEINPEHLTALQNGSYDPDEILLRNPEGEMQLLNDMSQS